MILKKILGNVLYSASTSSAMSFSTTTVTLNAHRASLGKIGREKFIKQYQTTIMLPDGSTINARTKEPRHLIQFPVDLKSLNEEERLVRLAARKPKVKQIKEEVIDDNFDPNQYASFFKKDKPKKKK